MSDHSSIEWTEATWNPVVGCTHVSPGCDHCYAARQASGRLSTTPTYAGLASEGRFTGEVRLLPERLDQPLRWRRPRRIFVNSMSDLFHQDVPDEFIARVFAVMAASPRHTFQVLTKRHARMRALLSDEGFGQQVRRIVCDRWGDGTAWMVNDPSRWPLPNVWLGVSVEDQHWADIRIPALLDTPAAVRWISAEPLLGPVDVTRWLHESSCALPAEGVCTCCEPFEAKLDWVVAGGESGPAARPMHPEWARSLRDECQAAGVPYLFKQWGEWRPVEPDICSTRVETDWLIRCDGHTWPLTEPHGAEDATAVTIRHFGKKVAGRDLDGRIWDEYPVVSHG